MMAEVCKKCLLLEAGEAAAHDGVIDYLKSLDKNSLAEENEYNRRLNFCRKCDFLISGMCYKCGCYVEVRAAVKNQHCPNYDNRQW